MPTSDTMPADDVGPSLLQADDIIEALAKRHPATDAKVIEEAGRVVALISRIVLSDVDIVRRFRDIGDDALLNVVHEMKARIDGHAALQMHASERHAPEIAGGTGLGEVIGITEGRHRLAARAGASTLEDWAGPVAGLMDLSDRQGISASNLRDWHRTRAIIDLSKERQKPVFPLQQFVQHRPVPRLADLQAVIGDPRMTWLWLVEPGRDGMPSWLDMLKEGRVEEVLEAAQEDFA